MLGLKAFSKTKKVGQNNSTENVFMIINNLKQSVAKLQTSKGEKSMTRSATKKTNRFLAFIMVAVLLANCLPLTVFGATEELLPFDSQATENTTCEGGML